MANRLSGFFNRHWSFLATDTRLLLPALVTVVTASLYGSLCRGDWQLIARAGNLVIFVGVVLTLRRLFRLGDKSITEKVEPWTLPREPGAKGVQFNFARVNQEVFAIGDARAQKAGFYLILIGTFMASYADLLLDWLIPFG
jgi:hypothetical protein